MIKNYLLPNIFKKIGLWMVLPFLAGSLYSLLGEGAEMWTCRVFSIICDSREFFGFGGVKWFSFIKEEGIFDEISMIGLTISLIFISFSKEKDEDEFILQIRLQSLVWALLVSSVIFIFGIMFIYDLYFMYFCFVYPYFIFLFFIAKFNYELMCFHKEGEEQK